MIDQRLAAYLQVFGAVLVERPKWFGKTWTSLAHASSASYLDNKSTRNFATIDPRYIFTSSWPQLIEEWQAVPSIWDTVRHECDTDSVKGKFILTGSTSLTKSQQEETVFHSGTGRIASIRMETMSLFELGASSGTASIEAMHEGTLQTGYARKVEQKELAEYIVRNGWPANQNTAEQFMNLIPEQYLKSVIEKDIHERTDKRRDSRKMRQLIKSLARNESTVVSNRTIIKDVEECENGEEFIRSQDTVADYLSVLEDLFLTVSQPASSVNYRSSARVGKAD